MLLFVFTCSCYLFFILIYTLFFFTSNCLILIYLEEIPSAEQFAKVSLFLNIMILLFFFLFFLTQSDWKELSFSYFFLMVQFISFIFIINTFVIGLYFLFFFKLISIPIRAEHLYFLGNCFNLTEDTYLSFKYCNIDLYYYQSSFHVYTSVSLNSDEFFDYTNFSSFPSCNCVANTTPSYFFFFHPFFSHFYINHLFYIRENILIFCTLFIPFLCYTLLNHFDKE